MTSMEKRYGTDVPRETSEEDQINSKRCDDNDGVKNLHQQPNNKPG